MCTKGIYRFGTSNRLLILVNMKNEYTQITQIYTFDDIEDLFNFIKKNQDKIIEINIKAHTVEFKCYKLLDDS